MASTAKAAEPAPVEETPFEREAAGAVSSPAFRALLADHWRATLEADPLLATHLGVHEWDDAIPDASLVSVSASRGRNEAFLARAKALQAAEMSEADVTTLALFVEGLESELAGLACRYREWSISPRGNPVTEWSYLPELHQVASLEDLRNLVARYRGIAGSISDEIAALSSGAADGLYANRESVQRVVTMVEQQLEQPTEEWPLYAPARASYEGLEPDEVETLKSALAEIVVREIRPALVRYGTFLEEQILPHARASDATGLSALPLGEDCYAAQIRAFTTLDLDAKTIHETGLAEAARIDAEMQALGEKLFGILDRAEVLAHLRKDPALHFDTAEAVEQKAESALAKAKAALPKWFGRLPKADCVVRRIPDYEAPFTTVAYYRQPNPDGSKPGEYFVNVYQPKTRPRYEAEALAFHESIPGHHVQIAIAQEMTALPAFRKYLGMTVFVEGWALYAEQLSDEMGLYSSDLDRMGMLSYEAWRAARLVVDTGIHAFGWSREQAKAFMREHTALAENNIDNEVDRYIVWPGQALAYKTGQLEIWRLRRAAEAALGEAFDIKAFHDAVLGGGAVTLSVLREQVEAFERASRAQ